TRPCSPPPVPGSRSGLSGWPTASPSRLMTGAWASSPISSTRSTSRWPGRLTSTWPTQTGSPPPPGGGPPAEPPIGARPEARAVADRAADRAAGLDLRSAEPLALTGQRSPPPSLSAPYQTAGTGPDSPPRVRPPDAPPRVSRPPAATYRGLPRRTRQASLSPHLQGGPPAADRPSGTDPVPSDTHTPEQARDLAASLQSGWQRGRLTETPDAQPAAGARTAGRQAAESPHSEEA